MNPLANIRRKVVKNGTIRRGAVSRIAEFVGSSPTTVKKWLEGEWSPGKRKLAMLEDICRSKMDLRAKRSGPKGPWRQRKNGHG